MDLERKKTDASCISRENCLVKANLILSLSIAMVLLSLHPSSVPDAFVICIMLSFTGSFCWLFMGENPKHPTVRRCYFMMSTIFMASALSLLASALLLQFLWLSSPGTQKISGFLPQIFALHFLVSEPRIDLESKKKKKTVSQVEEVDASCMSPECHSSHGKQTRLVKATMVLCLSIVLAMLSLHQSSGN